MTYPDLLVQARQGLLAHRMRATLSSLGIIVGVGTVVASLAVNDGARRAALRDIGALGIDNTFVRATSASGEKGKPLAPDVTRADAAAIALAVRNVAHVSVSRVTRAEVVSEGRTSTAAVAGVSAGWLPLMNLHCGRGRCLSSADEQRANRVAVVGAGLIRRLQPGRDPLGTALTVNGDVFRIVGVLERIEQRAGAAAAQTFSPDDAVLVPVTTMDVRLGEGDSLDRVSEIGVRAASGADVDQLSADVAALMARRHAGSPKRYEMVVPRELLRARLQAQRTFDIVLLATGLIALIISGVGIMNIMLASVVERHQEIGVRRAVGARRREIVTQFAVEAALLCVAGGVAGVPLGGSLAWTVSLFAGWPVAMSFASVVLALGLAAATGLTFGIYPAYQAASIDPIEALRA